MTKDKSAGSESIHIDAINGALRAGDEAGY